MLVFGPDAGLVSERVDAIIRASVDDTNDPFALVRLDGDTLASDPARLIDEATTVPLFGGRRAIRVRAGSRNIVPAVEGVLAARLRDCRVVIEAGDLKRGAALRNACERAKTAVAIPCYADGDRDIARLIDEEMRAADLTIAPDARAALMPLLGGDRRASRAELRKLALYAHGQERVEIDDVMAVVADASALGARRAGRCRVRRRLAEVETEFAKAAVAGTIAGRDRRRGAAPGRAAARAAPRRRGAARRRRRVIEQAQPPIHFRRKPLVETALKAWTSERLAQGDDDAGARRRSMRALQADLVGDDRAARAASTIARSGRRSAAD